MKLFRIGKAKHGKGLFATRAIKPGEIILKFSGPKINYQQVLRMKNPDNALAISKRKYLNLRSPGVYANHACTPNSGITPELYLIAIEPIRKDQEIRWDYSTTLENTRCDFQCDCGTKNCRKEITDFTELPKKKQQYYLKNGVVLPFIVKLI